MIQKSFLFGFSDDLFLSKKLEETSKSYEIRSSRVKNSSYETELRKITSHVELLTQIFFE